MDKRKQGKKKEEGSHYIDMKSVLKDIEYMGMHLGPSHVTWKEKKAVENKKVVSHGGKPSKKQKLPFLPLSVARVIMKKQKERDQKMLQENILHGQVGGKCRNGSKRASVSYEPEDRVLMSTAGHFRNGVLDVIDLLKSKSTSSVRGGSRSRGFGGGSSSHGFGCGFGVHGFGCGFGVHGFGKGDRKNHGMKGGHWKGR